MEPGDAVVMTGGDYIGRAGTVQALDPMTKCWVVALTSGRIIRARESSMRLSTPELKSHAELDHAQGLSPAPVPMPPEGEIIAVLDYPQLVETVKTHGFDMPQPWRGYFNAFLATPELVAHCKANGIRYILAGRAQEAGQWAL